MIPQERYRDSPNPNSVKEGEAFQDFASHQLRKRGLIVTRALSEEYQYRDGDSPEGIEFKLDNRCTMTGWLSIEYEEKVTIDSSWAPSGISKECRTWLYVQGNRHRFWAFGYRFLKTIYELGRDGYISVTFDEHETIKTFYLSFDWADRLSVLRFPEDFDD